MKINKVDNCTPQIGGANDVQKRAILCKYTQLVVQLNGN